MGGYYLLFTIIIVAIKLIIQSYYGITCIWTYEDTLSLAFSGSCKSFDVLNYPLGTYALHSQLWFLYAGAVAMLLLYLLRSVIFRNEFISIFCVAFIVSQILQLLNILPTSASSGFYGFRLIFIAFPFLYIGLLIRKFENQMHILLNNYILGIGIIIFTVCLYLEAIFCNTNSKEVLLMTPYLTVAIVLFLIFNPNLGSKVITKLNSKSTLDIYVWHRPVYLLLCIIGLNINAIAALYVYLICAVISISVRRVMLYSNTRC